MHKLGFGGEMKDYLVEESPVIYTIYGFATPDTDEYYFLYAKRIRALEMVR